MFNTLVLRNREEKAILRDPELAEKFSCFNPDMVNFRTYVVALEAGKVVGMVALLDQTMRMENAVGVGFVESHLDHRNRGIARVLVDGLFQYARKSRKAIANSAYTSDGRKWLQPLIKEAAERYPDVPLHEREF